MSLKILDLGAHFHYPIRQLFDPWVWDKKAEIIKLSYIHNLDGEIVKDCDLICFGGGADIHPDLYGHKNVGSQVGDGLSRRDIFERYLFEYALELKKPILGICRGAQLVCALSGGKLIQDVGSNHCYPHNLEFLNRDSLKIASTHHQMMYLPEKLENVKILAWTKPLSERYVHDIENFVKPAIEPEIVLFPNRVLAIQGHPEYQNPLHETPTYCRQLIETLLLQ
jgi:putative glutamine amidotransferase